MSDYRERLNRQLSPEIMSLTLVRAGALLTGYELIKTSIVDDVRNFFTVGFDDAVSAARYHAEVDGLGAHPVERSIRWLVNNEALTEKHAETLEQIRTHRNKIAHELVHQLIDPDADPRPSLLLELGEIFVALDRFWGPIHIDTNPDFDGQDVGPEGFFSGPRMVYGLLLGVAKVA